MKLISDAGTQTLIAEAGLQKCCCLMPFRRKNLNSCLCFKTQRQFLQSEAFTDMAEDANSQAVPLLY